MTLDHVGWAMLFLAAVGLMVAVGVVVGIIVAGRLDRLMAPTTRPPGEDAPAKEDLQP